MSYNVESQIFAVSGSLTQDDTTAIQNIRSPKCSLIAMAVALGFVSLAGFVSHSVLAAGGINVKPLTGSVSPHSPC